MKEKRTVGIIYKKSEIENLSNKQKTEKAFLDSIYNEPYLKISKIANEKNIRVCVSSPEEFDGKNFKNCWMYEMRTGWLKMERVKLDLIFNKFMGDISNYQSFYHTDIQISNPLGLDKICSDKYLTYTLFQSLTPQTILLKGVLTDNDLEKISSKRVVLKPRKGYGGKGIFIDLKSEVKKIRLNPNNDYLIQEFIDTTEGFREINIKGIHDFRLVVINGEIVDAYVRQPQTGFISNTSLGGSIIPVKNKDIPSKVIEIKNVIDKKFDSFKPRVYSIDLLKGRDGTIYLGELNSKPGVDDLSPEQEKSFFNEIVNQIFCSKEG